MNWGVLWYIDFANWNVISPCTEAIQTYVILVETRSFTQCFNTILWQTKILRKWRVLAQRVTNN